jgi:hypothetical protein
MGGQGILLKTLKTVPGGRGALEKVLEIGDDGF